METEHSIDDQRVVEYLRSNPDFFQIHADELSELRVAHASGSAVSLIERQVEVLRERIFRMRRRMNQLLRTARSNDQLFFKVRSLSLALLDVSNWQDLNEVLAINMQAEFDADFLCCHVQCPHLSFDHIRGYEGAAPFTPFVSSSLPACVTLRARELQALFPQHNHAIKGSAVLLPLASKRGAGCLAIGSRETGRFTRDLDTMFVGYIGDLLSRVIDRLDWQP